MSDLDRYDVEAMIRDANYRNASAADLDNARAAWREERDALRAEIDELCERVASLQRTLDSRTEHLV